MATSTLQLPFENRIKEIEGQLRELEAKQPKTANVRERIRQTRKTLNDTIRSIYKNLDPWETVRVARHPERPQMMDYVDLVFDEFVELHGDKFFGDDRALRTGFAKLGDIKLLLLGHQKGKTTKERTECFFGCAHPEGYRKAMRKMKLAAKYGLPIVTFIDTPGAYPGVGAEERGQAQVIAESMQLMSQLKTPIVCVVIGEGGSGGALGIGVGDRVAVLEYAYYSVISPEGCAGILWKSHDFAPQAARALRITSRHLSDLGVIDDVVEEPLGAAHRDHYQMAGRLKMYLLRTLRELQGLPIDELLAGRYAKYRKIGRILEPKE
ncbi:acetyl-CoA carboxylase carboxyltransferase subunit alpha [Pirellulales bacterium]|nr:acetyl-CoA carboxylase carboxyltransferase subunit alpha [Pirellulales bacterium]